MYYGRLRGTAFKWFDVVALFEGLLADRDQSESLSCVHLFTAPALAKFATHGQASAEAQSAYHRALQALHGNRVNLVMGKHTYDHSGALLPTFVEGQPCDRTVRSRVWRLEEKQTDVNLALAVYRGACADQFDRMILVTNDSDQEPTLQALADDFPHIMRGVVLPIRPPSHPGADPHRRQSGSLTNLAHWTISSISDELLTRSQLPATVPTRKKPIRKPAHW